MISTSSFCSFSSLQKWGLNVGWQSTQISPRNEGAVSYVWEPGILHQAALPPVIKQQEQGLAKFLETITIIAIKYVQSTCSVSHTEYGWHWHLRTTKNYLNKARNLQTFLAKSDSTWNWDISDPLEMTVTISLSFPKHLVILKRKWALYEMEFLFTSCVFLHFSPRSPV